MKTKEAITESAGKNCSLIFGVPFSAEQNAVLEADETAPRWDLNPPQREEYECDRDYALGLRDYADRLIAANACLRGRE